MDRAGVVTPIGRTAYPPGHARARRRRQRHLGPPAGAARARAAARLRPDPPRHQLARAAVEDHRPDRRRRHRARSSSRSSLVKFFSIFIAVAAYALIWGWKFAIGVVVLIFVHELGHFIEAKREGLHPKLPVFIPFLGAYVAYTRGHPWQTVRVAIAGPILGGAAAFVFYLARAVARLRPPLRARVLRLLPQPVQPDPVRDLRRRRRLALRALPPPRRRPQPRARVVRAVLRDGCDAGARHGRVTRPAAPPVTDDRQILDHPAPFDIDASVKKIADEFRAGFEKVAQIDRPAAALFGSARVKEGSAPYEAARAVGKLFAERGWAVVTGGGGGVMEGANRGAQEGNGLSVGFNIVLPHEQAPNPYVDISYTFEHFYARKVCFVRPSEGFVDLPRRLRHARRALRVADADPDRQDQALPRRALRHRVLARDDRLDPRRPARGRDDLAGRSRPAAPDRRPGGSGRLRARSATSAAARTTRT